MLSFTNPIMLKIHLHIWIMKNSKNISVKLNKIKLVSKVSFPFVSAYQIYSYLHSALKRNLLLDDIRKGIKLTLEELTSDT